MRTSHLILALFFQIPGMAQLPVRMEPRHHNVFENDRIRILDINLRPGDTTFYHYHETPSAFVFFTHTLTVTQPYGKQPAEGWSTAGDFFYDALSTPRYHRVWNVDTGWFHVNDMELLGNPSGKPVPILTGVGIKQVFNEPRATGYRINGNAGQKIELPASSSGYLLMSLGQAGILLLKDDGVLHLIMQAGHYQWLSGNKSILLELQTEAPMGFALVQMK